VLLAKQEAAVKFNDAVGDDLEITINILNDLNNAKQSAMNVFTRTVRKLIPHGAPKSSWDTGFDRKQLLDSLEDYIGSRVDQLRIQGVLPRGRKPIDVSFNLFLNHPLGEDHLFSFVLFRFCLFWFVFACFDLFLLVLICFCLFWFGLV
jgi:hypothetical protein